VRRLPKVFAFVDFAVTIPMEELHIIWALLWLRNEFRRPARCGKLWRRNVTAANGADFSRESSG